MSDSTALLDYADQVLGGDVDLGGSAPRTAALLARCALEVWLDDQSQAWMSRELPYPSTRSKLVALEVLRDDPSLGDRARAVWSALSRAVHHHAYDLQPSAAEVRHLVTQVRGLHAYEAVAT